MLGLGGAMDCGCLSREVPPPAAPPPTISQVSHSFPPSNPAGGCGIEKHMHMRMQTHAWECLRSLNGLRSKCAIWRDGGCRGTCSGGWSPPSALSLGWNSGGLERGRLWCLLCVPLNTVESPPGGQTVQQDVSLRKAGAFGGPLLMQATADAKLSRPEGRGLVYC